MSKTTFKVNEKLKERRSFQKILRDRLKKAGEEPNDPNKMEMLGLKEITSSNIWVLQRILYDAPENKVKDDTDIESLMPALVEFTPANYRWIREIHESTLQGLSYIVNRLIESCRLDTFWEIDEAKPKDVVKAMEILKKHEFDRKFSTKKISSKDRTSFIRKEGIEPGHGDNGS